MADSIRARLVKLLVENTGNTENTENYTSGSALAKELSVSRAAVWKAVESLRAEGYVILATTNKGYRLVSGGGSFSKTGIERLIKTANVFQVGMRKSVTSTNSVLRDLAARGASEGMVLVADEQTAGKGRQGRAFHSPAGHGAYFSLLLRPGSKTADATLITSAAAVATARAIEEVTGARVGIKWVNDLLLGRKKVCGILTEAAFGVESGLVDYVVLGIGINVTRPENGFPGTLDDVACSLLESANSDGNERCRLIAATLDNFWEYYQDLSGRRFLEEYRARSIMPGNDIFVLKGDEKIPAHALAIDDDCRLIIRYDDGGTTALNSGEVSVRSQ